MNKESLLKGVPERDVGMPAEEWVKKLQHGPIDKKEIKKIGPHTYVYVDNPDIKHDSDDLQWDCPKCSHKWNEPEYPCECGYDSPFEVVNATKEANMEATFAKAVKTAMESGKAKDGILASNGQRNIMQQFVQQQRVEHGQPAGGTPEQYTGGFGELRRWQQKQPSGQDTEQYDIMKQVKKHPEPIVKKLS